MPKAQRLLILDRDGVINRDRKDYIKTVAEWQPLPGSLQAMARLSRAGFSLRIASNQSAVARGLIKRDTLAAIHARLRQQLQSFGGRLAGIHFCPHGPDAGCFCRKPLPGLLHEIAACSGLTSWRHVWMVGDSLRDIAAARAAGAQPILLRSGHPLPEQLPEVPLFDHLPAFAEHLLATEWRAAK